ncbi:cytochrome P450 [Microthyrium microscopicum]|uniref:Cytochrome P450 n=1 Tax=Microthyrium microscopicum TaxID=703497 RepID=A0A6A6UBI6_9PEZI|nr:cytochrome P450 [Microthyrium microscopicum]
MTILDSFKNLPVPILLPASVAGLAVLYTANVPATARIPIAASLLAVAFIGLTHIFTRLRYSYQLSQIKSPGSKTLEPPQIYYSLPFLGNALDFLAPGPGLFWKQLFKSHPRDTGACTLLLGGLPTHILFDPTAVQAIFKAKGPNRDRFNEQVMGSGFGFPRSEVVKFFALGQPASFEYNGREGLTAREKQEAISHEYLMKTDAVNELTSTFVFHMRKSLNSDDRLAKGQSLEIGLVEYLRPHLFKASIVALMGERLLEIYPELSTDFWEFDKYMLTLFFGLPRFVSPKAYKALEKCKAGMLRQQEICFKECNGEPEDPSGSVGWEPIWGSRANRSRQCFYKEVDMLPSSKAAADLAFMFGIASNAIPAAGWFLMHLLDPYGDQTLLPRLMKELKTAQRPDGSLDVSTLCGLTLLQSMWQEILRLYTDVLVTRDTRQDITLPFDEGKKKMLFRAGSVIMAPSYLGHHDERAWMDPPCEQFYAERFLVDNPETGLSQFSMNGTPGKLFPFGGGKTICPGRIFAKQEVLASVAMVLLTFDFDFVSYTDLGGNKTSRFPGPADVFQGTGVIAGNGDVRVRIKRKLT